MLAGTVCRVSPEADIKKSLHNRLVEIVEVERGWALIKMLERAASRRTFYSFEVGETLWAPLDCLVEVELSHQTP